MSRPARRPDELSTTRRKFQKIITDSADVADYDQRHSLYSQLTVVGDPARAVLARLANEYRALA